MKKGLWLFITILILIFSIPLKSNAAELYTANITFGLCQYDNDSFSGIYANIGGTYTLTSNNPIYVYWYNPYEVPTNASGQEGQVFIITKGTLNGLSGVSTCTYNGETYSFYGLRTSFGGSSVSTRAFFFTAFGDGAEIRRLNKIYDYSNLQDIISCHLDKELDYRVNIDWDNMQYNETIGFLQNVMLKASGSLNKDFEITWSNNDWQFQDDEFRVQIGYHTRFQETLFGELRLYTDLDYISWDDGLYYSTGKWSCNVDDLFTAIPNCNHPAYTGNFYLRIVRVNSSTGSVEYGPWGQLSWVIHKSPDDGGRAVSSEYVTLKNSNVFSNDGVTDLYDEQYEIDSDSPTSQKYVVNTNNGSIDSFSTGTYDTLYNEFGELDFSKIGDYFTTGISSLYNSLHDFPTLVSKVASFLPKEIYAIIGISIVVIILSRVFGR